MIEKDEINRQAENQGLRFDQIEKDHVILWILRALSQSHLKPAGWVFKGGTCLRHCFYDGYRFSEDLDFSCRPAAGGIEETRSFLTTVADWIRNKSLLRLSVKEVHSSGGDFQAEIPIQYSRGGSRRQGLPEVKLHFTFDEPILTRARPRRVKPGFSDLTDFSVLSYSKEEILAEKMRALLQQQLKWPRPRDLYDLWFILCYKRERFDWKGLYRLFIEKCRVRKIEPDKHLLTSEELRAINETVWSRQLGAVMASVPDYAMAWREWAEFCSRTFAEQE